MQTDCDPKIPNLLKNIYFDEFSQYSERSVIEKYFDDTKKKKKKEDRHFPVLSGILFLRKREFQWCKTLE